MSLEDQVRNFSPGSIASHKGHLKYFISLYSVDAARQDLSDFLVLIRDEKGLSPSTVQNYFITLSTFYEFLRYESVVEENPIIPFKKRFIHYFKTPRTEERRLITLKQMKKLILFPDDLMWKTVFCMYAKTGIRRQELIDLDADDLNIRERKRLFATSCG